MARLLELVPAGHELVERPDGVELAVYVTEEELGALRARLPALQLRPVVEGWEDGWRAFHRPAVVGRLWVGPPWLTPPDGLEPIVIDPGRAFGTGGHATTRLCLAILQDLPAGSLVDVGCGSGVLAIAAARLGHAPVLALDVDTAATEAARLNASCNGVTLEIRELDALRGEPVPAADLVVANIERGAVERLARRVRARRLVASGYLAGEAADLPGWRQLERRTESGWAADLYAPQ